MPPIHSRSHLQTGLDESVVGPGRVHEGGEPRLEVRVPRLVHRLPLLLRHILGGVELELLQVEAAVHVREYPATLTIL